MRRVDQQLEECQIKGIAHRKVVQVATMIPLHDPDLECDLIKGNERLLLSKYLC